MKRRDWLKEYKSKLKCERCGYNKCVGALSFHHRNPEEKFTSPNNMIGIGFGKKKILREIEKCQILCLNCHSELHYNEQKIKQITDNNIISILITKIIRIIYIKIKNYLKRRLEK